MSGTKVLTAMELIQKKENKELKCEIIEKLL